MLYKRRAQFLALISILTAGQLVLQLAAAQSVPVVVETQCGIATCLSVPDGEAVGTP